MGEGGWGCRGGRLFGERDKFFASRAEAFGHVLVEHQSRISVMFENGDQVQNVNSRPSYCSYRKLSTLQMRGSNDNTESQIYASDSSLRLPAISAEGFDPALKSTCRVLSSYSELS